MPVSILPVPFTDAARQRQYEEVLAALHAEQDAPTTVLLGNLGAFTPIEADLLLVRPTKLVLGVLAPGAGHLTVPALAHGSWQLDGQPLPSGAADDNPFAQYQRQLPPALAWLSEQLNLPAAELPPCLGIALFEAPLTFGPGVEAQLHHPDALAFELVGDATQLPARLHQVIDYQTYTLTEDELLDWADYLATALPTATTPAEEPSVGHYLAQQLRQLWGWLGAADIPADPPYGALPSSADHLLLRDQQEQARLQQLRQELLAELAQHRQEAATREAARTQELAQLRQQLAQTSQTAPARAAEQQERARLEADLRTARTELAARNQELDARLRQLNLLIAQLPTPGASPAAAPRPGLAPPPAAGLAPHRQPAYRRLYQAERWGLVALALAIVGAGAWGLLHAGPPANGRPLSTVPHRAARYSAEAAHAPAPVIIYDTVATPRPAPHTDTATTPAAAAPETAPAPATAPARDSAAPASLASPPPAPADSAAARPER